MSANNSSIPSSNSKLNWSSVKPSKEVPRSHIDLIQKGKSTVQFLTPVQKALFDAIHQSKLSEVQSLLDKGVEVNVFNSEGQSPLALAFIKKIESIAKVLLSKAKPDDACYQLMLEARLFSLSESMLMTGSLPSANFEFPLIDPQKRLFAKRWLAKIQDPSEKFAQALQMKEFEMIESAYKELPTDFDSPKFFQKYAYASMQAWKTACQSFDEKLIKMLVELGFDPTCTDPNGNNGLHLAVNCEIPKKNILEYLLGLNVINRDQINQAGRTPLQELLFVHQKSSNKMVDTLALFLLKQGVTLAIKDETSQILWERFFNSQDMTLKAYLLESRHDLVLVMSCQKSSYHILEALLKENPSFTPHSRFLAWKNACSQRDVRILKTLIDNQLIDISSAKDEEGNTTLHLIAATRNLALLDYVMNLKRIDLNQTNHQGVTPLQILLQNERMVPEIVSMVLSLLTSGVKVAHKKDWQIIWKWVCHMKDPQCIKTVCELKEVDLLNKEGEASPLHFAVEASATEIVALLLTYGKWKINQCNSRGETALFILCNTGDPLVNLQSKREILQQLFAAGANPNLADKKSIDPLYALLSHAWKAFKSELELAWNQQGSKNNGDFGSQSPKEQMCVIHWLRDKHDFLKSYIDLFMKANVNTVTARSFFETTFWEEMVIKSVVDNGIRMYTNTQYFGSYTQTTTTTTYSQAKLVGEYSSTRKHLLKDVLKSTYAYLS